MIEDMLTHLLPADRAFCAARIRQGRRFSRAVTEWFDICAERASEGAVRRLRVEALIGLRRLFGRAMDWGEGRHVLRLNEGELSMDRRGLFRIDYEPVMARTGRLLVEGVWVRSATFLGCNPVRYCAEWGIGCVACGGEEYHPGLCDACNAKFVIFSWGSTRN